jgi:hypothetical protein
MESAESPHHFTEQTRRRGKIMKTRLWVALVIIALLCLVGWTGFTQKSQASKQGYEYKVIIDPTQHGTEEGNKAINGLGAEGWELVGVSNQVGDGGYSTHTRLFFKRAK